MTDDIHAATITIGLQLKKIWQTLDPKGHAFQDAAFLKLLRDIGFEDLIGNDWKESLENRQDYLEEY